MKEKIKNGRSLKKANKTEEGYILTRRSKGEKILFGCVFAIFVLYALSLISPFLYLFFNSLKDGFEYSDDLMAGNTVGLPDAWRFSNYISAFTNMKMTGSSGQYIYMWQMVLYGVGYSFISVLAGITASTLVAYALAKYRFRLRGLLYGIAIFSMTVPVIGNTGAMFKLLASIGVYNTPFYPVVVGFSGFGFNFLILYGFFSTVSWSYAEASFIDGAGHFTVLFKVMIPQALPAMVTLCIMAFITSWNDYLNVLLYMPDYPTLASGIYQIKLTLKRNLEMYPVYFAGLIISIVPVMVLFACFSNTIMKNFTVGGLKG